MKTLPPPNLYERHRVPAEMISHWVWLSCRSCGATVMSKQGRAQDPSPTFLPGDHFKMINLPISFNLLITQAKIILTNLCILVEGGAT